MAIVRGTQIITRICYDVAEYARSKNFFTTVCAPYETEGQEDPAKCASCFKRAASCRDRAIWLVLCVFDGVNCLVCDIEFEEVNEDPEQRRYDSSER